MNNNYRLYYIKECLFLIESKFNRGASQQWTNYDFEKLSEEIQEVTGVLLSITTLKRVFGKVKYNSAPSTVTLNALARYVGFADWGEFRSKKIPEHEPTAGTTKKMHTRTLFLSKRFYWWMGSIAAVLLLFVFFIGLPKGSTTSTQNSSLYAFSSNKVLTAGVPNSVIFNYDATAAENDSVFITQSWDISRKKLVSKNNKTFSSIYYYPGFYQAKLIVGNKVKKHHNLMIASNGWLAAVMQPDVPIYFKKEEFLKNSMVNLTPSLLEAYHLPLQPHAPTICLFNVRNLPGLQNDNFTFETTLKSEFSGGSAACQNISVQILCKNDVIAIPLCAKGCVGNLQLFAAGSKVSSSESDLSGFGCDLTKWVTLKVEAKNKYIHFIINGKEAYSLKFPNPTAEIIGVEYIFNGTAAVKKAGFKNATKSFKLL